MQLALTDKTEGEVDMNRRLYTGIIAASHELARESSLDALPVVVPEGRNPPVASDPVEAARERKIPDFYWAYIDHLAPDPAAAARQFVVECKRLTVASRSWIYTEQYVRAGVARFVNAEHAYGKDAPSGAMVGYLQLLTADDALDEVNACAQSEGLPPLANRSSAGKLVEFDHVLSRPFDVSPFRLTHVWASE